MSSDESDHMDQVRAIYDILLAGRRLCSDIFIVDWCL